MLKQVACNTAFGLAYLLSFLGQTAVAFPDIAAEIYAVCTAGSAE